MTGRIARAGASTGGAPSLRRNLNAAGQVHLVLRVWHATRQTGLLLQLPVLLPIMIIQGLWEPLHLRSIGASITSAGPKANLGCVGPSSPITKRALNPLHPVAEGPTWKSMGAASV